MKKVLMVVALLLWATPLFAADVTVTATTIGAIDKTAEPNWTQKVRVGYTGAAEVNTIRAFALVMTVDSGTNLDHIADFNRGESTTPGGGFGIFPGKVRQFINAASPNWVDTNYNPIAPSGDPNGTGGNDNPRMVVELGTLYKDANAPGTSGTLFTVDVNSEGAAECNLCFAVDATRGGVVKKDATAATVTLPGTAGCIKVLFPRGVSCPNIVTLTTTAADACIVSAGLNKKTTTGKYSDTVSAGIVMTQDPAAGTLVPLASDVNYVYSLGRFPTPAQILYPKWDPDSNVPVYWSQVAGATSYSVDRSANSGSTWTNVYSGTATFKAESLATGANYRWRAMAKNADSNSLYVTGTYDCNAYLSRCYKDGLTSDANWAQWLSMGRPDCWCKASGLQEPNGSGYQCDGDADGSAYGTYRIYTGDLSMLTNNWKKTKEQLTSDPNVLLASKIKVTSACADFDHKAYGTYRIYTADLTTLTTNWKKTNSSTSTATSRLPGNCPR